MPLVRYEIRSEYELANRELYRSAPKNDPEAILEGVAMVSLVGIVRQLGDLAEFAADIFHELHEAVMATASRSHDLSARVSQLEAELPVLEKLMLSKKANPLQFAYSPGVDWHASIRSDQNHCTQGDLPRFIRSSYEECRGPPRLFLLDKFDVGGVGACLKRYTDPSFFKMDWASSELMKAEKAQQDKKARRSKKTRRRKEGDVKEPRPPVQLQPRMRYSTISTSSLDGLSESTTPLTAMAVDNEHTNKPFPFVTFLGGSQHGSSKDIAPKAVKSFDAVVAGESVTKEPEEKVLRENSAVNADMLAIAAVEDVASEPEQFLDAMTTMESESDSEFRRLSNFKPEVSEPEGTITRPAYETDVFYEDARNSTMDSETEVESKYSADLALISVVPRSDDSQQETTHLQSPVSKDTAVERDILEVETSSDPVEEHAADQDSRPQEGFNLEKIIESGIYISKASSEHDGEPHSEVSQVLDSEHDRIDVIPNDSDDEDGVAADEEEIIPESNEGSSQSEGEPLLRAKSSSDVEDDDTFDVEVIQVVADEPDLKKEVEFEPLVASDEDSATETEMQQAVEAEEHLTETKHVMDDRPSSAHDDISESETDQNVEDELPAKDLSLEVDEEKLDVIEEPPAGDVLDSHSDFVGEKSIEVGFERIQAAQIDVSSVEESRSPTEVSNAEEKTTESAEEITSPITVNNAEESISPEGKSPIKSPVSVGEEEFESASSHEDFFMARTSSRFSDFSADDLSVHNEETEVDDYKEEHEGYLGDDDSAKNTHSEASEPGRSSLEAGTQDVVSAEKNLNSEIEEPILNTEPVLVVDVNKNSSEDEERLLESHESVDDNLHLVREGEDNLTEQQLPVGDNWQEHFGMQHQAVIEEVDLNKSEPSDVEVKKQLAAENVQMMIQPDAENSIHEQAAPSFTAFNNEDIRALASEIQTDDEPSTDPSSLSSSPRSPIFSALQAPLSPPATSANSSDRLSGFVSMLAPSSPSLNTRSFPSTLEGMPPLPPLPPLRWRTAASPMHTLQTAFRDEGSKVERLDRHFQVEDLRDEPEEFEVEPVEVPWTFESSITGQNHQRGAFGFGPLEVPQTFENSTADQNQKPRASYVSALPSNSTEVQEDFLEQSEKQGEQVSDRTSSAVQQEVLEQPEKVAVHQLVPLHTDFDTHGEKSDRALDVKGQIQEEEGTVSLTSRKSEAPTMSFYEGATEPLPETLEQHEAATTVPLPETLEQVEAATTVPLPETLEQHKAATTVPLPETLEQIEVPLPENLEQLEAATTVPLPETLEQHEAATTVPLPETVEQIEVPLPETLEQLEAATTVPLPETLEQHEAAKVTFDQGETESYPEILEQQAGELLSQTLETRTLLDGSTSPEDVHAQPPPDSKLHDEDSREDVLPEDDTLRDQSPNVQLQTHPPPALKLQDEQTLVEHETLQNQDTGVEVLPDRSTQSQLLELHDEQALVEAESTLLKDSSSQTTLPVSTMPAADPANDTSPNKHAQLHRADEASSNSPQLPPATKLSTEQTVVRPEVPHNGDSPVTTTVLKDPGDETLIQAISVHDRSKLKKVPSDTRSPPKASGERDVLLEQIRSQSFNLRHTVVEKKEIKEAPPRLVTNINVAAILEKANAIRQAFAGSDDEEEDDWSE